MISNLAFKRAFSLSTDEKDSLFPRFSLLVFCTFTLMKRISLFLFVLLLCVNNLFAQNWNTATPYAGRINDLFFVDAKTGFACGQGAGIGNCSGTGCILKTIDGGANWVRMKSSTTGELTRIQFVTPMIGWSMGASSAVMHTSDGGVTWTTQSSGVGAGLNDMYFVDANLGFVCGLNGLLRKTTNGGSTFTTIASGVTSTIYALSFLNSSVGYFVGDNGVIKKTTNGGTSFSSVYSGTDAFRDVRFLSADTGLVLSAYVIKRTTNGGGAWTTFNAPSGFVMTRFFFANKNIGFVVCDQGKILKTVDGGITWNVLPTPVDDFIYSIAFPDENVGYFGISYGRIYKTLNGGISWESNLSGFVDELTSVRFRDQNVGVAVGKYGDVFKTNNGGLNWTLRNNIPYVNLNTVRWLNNKSVIAAGYPNVLIKSDDEGMTWYDWNIPVRDSIYDIHVRDSNSVFITYGTGNCMKSLDGGVTWDTSMHTGSPYSLTGVFFLNNDTGFVCGQNLVYKTINGGHNWSLKNDSVNINSSFNDIQFTSNDTGYVAGDFGPLYRTVNGGAWWIDLYPSPTTNSDVQEMQFFTNDSGMFAASTSQKVTNNAGVNLSTMATACLANNWEMHSISVTENGYGYCVGGQFGILHTLQPDSLLRTYVQDSIFCSGDNIFVGYNASGFLLSTQVYSIELSDASGSFASPQIIGTFQKYSPMANPSGIITCQLPSGLNGTGFRVRIVSTIPALIGPDNGFNLTIKSSVTPTVKLVNNNANGCENELLQFVAQTAGAGYSPVYSWYLDNQLLNVNSSVLNIDSLTGNHNLAVSFVSSLNCANSIPTDSISFSISPAPYVNAGIDKSICLGDSVQIGDALIINSTQWYPSNNISNDTISSPMVYPYSSQMYVVESSNNSGCINRDSVFVTVYPNPLISVGSDVSLCEGDSALLTAGSFGSNILLTWSPAGSLSSDTGSSVYAFPTSNTMYTITATDSNNCSSSDFLNALVWPAPIIPIINIMNGNIVVFGNTQNLVWYLNGNILPGVNNDTLFLPVNGTYYVVATDNNGCTAVSQPLNYTIQNVKSLSQENFEIHCVDNSIVEINSLPGTSGYLKILDVNGRELLNKSFNIESSGSCIVNLPLLANGIYIVNLKSTSTAESYKMIITR